MDPAGCLEDPSSTIESARAPGDVDAVAVAAVAGLTAPAIQFQEAPEVPGVPEVPGALWSRPKSVVSPWKCRQCPQPANRPPDGPSRLDLPIWKPRHPQIAAAFVAARVAAAAKREPPHGVEFGALRTRSLPCP